MGFRTPNLKNRRSRNSITAISALGQAVDSEDSSGWIGFWVRQCLRTDVAIDTIVEVSGWSKDAVKAERDRM